jgi:hypothetical protein
MNGSRFEELATSANDDFGLKWQSALELHPKLALANRPANDEGSRRPNVDYVVAFQLLGEHGWPHGPVSANVDASQENNECHGGVLLTI